ncbi:20674_t:CDS:2, partial [Dentiscutata erythropus]
KRGPKTKIKIMNNSNQYRRPALSTTQDDTLLIYRHGNSNYGDMTNFQNINSINTTPLLLYDYNVATSSPLTDYVSNRSFRVPPTLPSSQPLLPFAPFNLSGYFAYDF